MTEYIVEIAGVRRTFDTWEDRQDFIDEQMHEYGYTREDVHTAELNSGNLKLPLRPQRGRIAEIRYIIEGDKDFLVGSRDPADVERVVVEWDDTNLSVGQIREYIEARVFHSDVAKKLHDAGISPEEAATRTGEDVGIGGYTDTIGYKVSNRDLSVGEALKYLGKRQQTHKKRSAGSTSNPTAHEVIGKIKEEIADAIRLYREGKTREANKYRLYARRHWAFLSDDERSELIREFPHVETALGFPIERWGDLRPIIEGEMSSQVPESSYNGKVATEKRLCKFCGHPVRRGSVCSLCSRTGITSKEMAEEKRKKLFESLRAAGIDLPSTENGVHGRRGRGWYGEHYRHSLAVRLGHAPSTEQEARRRFTGKRRRKPRRN